MKRIFFLAAIICLAQFAKAQQSTDSIPTGSEKLKTEKTASAYITLQGGQVMLVKENKAEKLDKDKTLADGTIVLTDGTVKKVDGTSLQMKEGDRIYLDGGMSLGKKDKDPMK
jgi:hypothetical protein